MPIEVWIPEEPAAAELGSLPPSVRVHAIPRKVPLPAGFRSAELVVPPFGSRRVLAALPRMRSLRLVRLKSAGIDWIEPHVPEWAALCKARGTRDAPVAESVLAAILASYKRLPHFLGLQGEARWQHAVPAELRGSGALIVGHGSIGAAERRVFRLVRERIRRRLAGEPMLNVVERA